MRAIFAAALVAMTPVPAVGQSLAARIAAVEDGSVTFHFASRRGVCGDGEHFVRIGRGSFIGRLTDDHHERACVEGPIQVRVTRSGGEVTRIEQWAGVPRQRAGSRDLGRVGAREAATYLLDLASRAPARTGEKAILPAVLADSVVVWPRLVEIARDRDGRRSLRTDAAFWLSQFAHAKLLGRPGDLGVSDREDGGEDAELRAQAIFVMSQLPRERSVPALLEIARTHRDSVIRGKALFWLAQSGDARAIDLFEQILR